MENQITSGLLRGDNHRSSAPTPHVAESNQIRMIGKPLAHRASFLEDHLGGGEDIPWQGKTWAPPHPKTTHPTPPPETPAPRPAVKRATCQ